MTWIVKNDRLESGLLIATKLDNSKFKFLINNIFQKIYKSWNNKVFFNNEEKENLQELLNLEAEDIDKAITAVTMIIHNAVYANIDVVTMKETLEKTFNFEKEKISKFCEYWIIHKQKLINHFEEQVTWPNVTNIKWSLDIETSSSIRSKEAECSVKLQLDIQDTTDQSQLTTQLDKESLIYLQRNLEQIQIKLDQLKHK